MANETARVYRVTVRGRFAELSDQARRYLVAAQPEHDIFSSAYTPEGTFTYDDKIDFFNCRYELRATAGDELDVETRGIQEATLFLQTMKFSHRDLKVDVVDMTAMWDATRD